MQVGNLDRAPARLTHRGLLAARWESLEGSLQQERGGDGGGEMPRSVEPGRRMSVARKGEKRAVEASVLAGSPLLTDPKQDGIGRRIP